MYYSKNEGKTKQKLTYDEFCEGFLIETSFVL